MEMRFDWDETWIRPVFPWLNGIGSHRIGQGPRVQAPSRLPVPFNLAETSTSKADDLPGIYLEFTQMIK